MSCHFPSTLLALCVLLFAGVFARAEPIHVEVTSGKEKVALLELYTSEGCSSCPPADRFVGNLQRTGWYPQQVIPLGFHVTYWNYIGWKDPYAQAQFDQRQRRIAERLKARTVYTPQLVLDGQDLRRLGRFGHRVSALNAEAPAARLTLNARSDAWPDVQVELLVDWTEQQAEQHAAVYLVLFENNLLSEVDAGENQGKTLQHDFVVRRLIGPLTAVDDAETGNYRALLRIPPEVDIANAGIAAFVENARDGSVLQAVAAPLVASAGN